MGFAYAAASWADVATLARRIRSDEAGWRRKLWRAIRRGGAHIPFLQDLLTAHYCAFDRRTPLYVKGILVGAIAYLVVPDHLIPKNLPLLNYADDAEVIALAMKAVASHI